MHTESYLRHVNEGEGGFWPTFRIFKKKKRWSICHCSKIRGIHKNIQLMRENVVSV